MTTKHNPQAGGDKGQEKGESENNGLPMNCIEGIAVMPTTDENILIMKKLELWSFSDLKSCESHCMLMMDYHHRRFNKEHDNIYKIQYSHWLWWFHLNQQVQYAINILIKSLSYGIFDTNN